MNLDQYLSGSKLFSTLNATQLEELKARCERIALPAGEILVHRGEPDGCLYLLTEGSLEAIKEADNGLNIKLAEYDVGKLISTSNLFDEHSTCATTLRATSNSELWSLDQTWLRDIVTAADDFAFNFIAYLSSELREEADKRAAMLSQQIDSSFKLTVFDAKKYEMAVFEQFKPDNITIQYVETRLTSESVAMASTASAVCVFVNDRVDRDVLEKLSTYGVGLIALRCAGFNNVDLAAAKELGISVTRVPAYSPYAVAEHALAMMMTLNRKIHRAYNRVREGNFYLNRLVGFDMHGRTAGIVGTGKIGRCLISILLGMGMKVLAWDAFPDEDYARQTGIEYVTLDQLLSQSDIISLHIPLMPETHHIIDAQGFEKMKPGAMLINTSRGGLVDTKALIKALKSKQLGSAGLDVYEEEEDYFFADHSGQIIDDDTLARLISFPNVLITSHQAFLTSDALENIAETTLASVQEYKEGHRLGELQYQVASSK